ncbi:acyl-CoA oxidase [Haloferax sp. YSMS24]|uniref:acyl-CoA oxidase n=1 Tax=unclassified Haloferax TaxID=2625095 RepID=UPI00398CBE70
MIELADIAVLSIVNYVIFFAGVGGFAAYIALEYIYPRHVSGWMLVALVGVSLTLVLFGAGVWTGGVDPVPIRALAAVCLVLAEIGLVRETVTSAG